MNPNKKKIKQSENNFKISVFGPWGEKIKGNEGEYKKWTTMKSENWHKYSYQLKIEHEGLSWWSSGKEAALQCQGCRFYPPSGN